MLVLIGHIIPPPVMILNELALGLVMSNSLKEYSFFTAVDGAVILVDAVYLPLF
jgi:hypothetical protein